MQNTIQVVGHLGSDPEEKVTKNNHKFMTFRMANTIKQRGAEDYTMWYTVNVWEGQGCYSLAKALKKGSSISVIGDYQDGLYTDRNGNSQIDRRISAVWINFYGSGERNAENAQQQQAQQTQKPVQSQKPSAQPTQPVTQTSAQQADPDEELPF